jgi:hypothetical protein
MGVQGSDLAFDDYLQAESAQDWIKSLETLNLEMAEKISKSSFDKFSKIFSNSQIAERAISSL